jgi:DNA-binding PadR family transcriptional regulator
MVVSSERQPSSGGWVVLGMLMDAPQSGYDLALMAARSVGQFWPVTKAHVYGELPRLERLGYIVGTHVAQVGVPDKRVFTATPAGRKAFASWIAAIGELEPRQYHPMLLQLFFCAQMEAAPLLAAVDGYRAHVDERKHPFSELLAQIKAHTPDTTVKAWSLPGRQLAIQHELSRLDAELRWLDEVRAELGGSACPAAVEGTTAAAQERQMGSTLQGLRT